jgi:SAM-dependent methyltransferase
MPAPEQRHDHTPFPADQARRIAGAFAPRQPWGNWWDYWYTRIKLGSDPLYPGVIAALRNCPAPVLDLGCGLGLFAHALRAAGLNQAYRGLDIDAAKISRGRTIAARTGLEAVQLDVHDLSLGWPAHRGSVTILDVLQYLNAPTQHALLNDAAGMLGDDGVLVIRSTMAEDSSRGRTSQRADSWAHRIGWMQASPRHYPTADGLRQTLQAAGLQVQVQPLYGNTPFNNWLIVARR